MGVTITPQHMINMIDDLAKIERLTGFSGSSKAMFAKRYMHHWGIRGDLKSIRPEFLSIIGSIELAIQRGLSGDPADLERFSRSLRLNIELHGAAALRFRGLAEVGRAMSPI